MFKKIYLTYNPKVIQDGYFSQLQRQLAIYAVAKRYKFSYYFTAISDVTITPLDSYQTKVEADSCTSEYNKIYDMREDFDEIEFVKIIEINSPSLYQIYWEGIKSVFIAGKVLIKIVLPYRIIEKSPEIYSYAIKRVVSNVIHVENKSSIVMHIRKGCLESHITPGESAPRALSTSYFIAVLNHIMKSKSFTTPFSLTIVTDAPAADYYYEPVIEQKHLWKQFEYLQFKNKVKVSGHSFNEIKELFPGKVKFIRGGDAQQAVSIMKQADHLVMSRSSMSYIGALLNTSGTIYYPPDFWHKPLKDWVEVAKVVDLL